MDKQDILEKYKKIEDKLLISKLFDKLDLCEKTGKVQTTDFLNELEQNIVSRVINMIGVDNCFLYGGFDGSDRKIVIVFPEKMRDVFERGNFKYDTIFSVFRIHVPEVDGKNFNHSVYLGGIIRLGIKREKIGDIIVEDDTADIVIKKESEKYLVGNLKTLTRFRDADISTISLSDICKAEKKFEEFKLITSSLRLDNMVSELAKTSRSKANEILEQERVFVNYEMEKKNTKMLRQNDIITIRGKGKFIIDEIAGNTKKGNFVIIVRKYA